MYSPAIRHLQISGDVFTSALMAAMQISETTGDVTFSGGISAIRAGIGLAVDSVIPLMVTRGTMVSQPTWNANDVAIFGNTAGVSAGIQALSDTSSAFIASSPSMRAAGYFAYNHSTNSWSIGVNGSGVAAFTSTGLNNTVIGATTPAAGSFTTLSASGNTGVGTASPDVFARGYGRILGISSASNAALEINATTGSGVYIDLGVNNLRTFGVYSDVSSTELATLGGNRPLTVAINGSLIGTFSSTGLAVTGAVSATATGAAFSRSGATTANVRLDLGNTGQTANFGVEASTGGAIVSGSTAYATVINSGANVPVEIGVNSVRVASFTSTGLSVTGLLSNTVADSAYGFKVIGGTGRLVVRPYIDATLGAVVDSINTAETGYLPLTFQGTTIKLRPSGTEVVNVASGAVSVTGTISASGDVTSGGILYANSNNTFPLRMTNQTTGTNAIQVTNTGGNAYFGQENSTGNNMIVGATGYDTIIRGPSGIAFSANSGNAMQMRLSSTGLSVTGTLTATGTITCTANSGPSFLANVSTISTMYITIGNTGGNLKLGMESSTAGSLISGDTGYDAVIRAVTPISFSCSAGAPLAMRLSSSGLAVTGTLGASGKIASTVAAGTNALQIEAGARFYLDGGGNTWIEETSADNVGFVVGGATRASITTTGLSVTGTLGASGNINNGTFGGDPSTGTADGATYFAVGQITASANGIPTLQLRRRTSDGTSVSFWRDTTQVGSISVTTTSTAYNTSSNANLKTSLGAFLLTDIAAPLYTLTLRKYAWNVWLASENKTTRARVAYGVFAQEAQKTCPWMVTHDVATDNWSVNWMALMPNVIAAIQVHKSEMDLLKEEVAALKTQVFALQAA